MDTENLYFHSESLIRDSKYEYMFHSDFPCSLDTKFDNYEKELNSNREKAAYLIAKLYKNASSDGRILYVHKYSSLLGIVDSDSARSKAEGMMQRLVRLHGARDNFDLVFVQPEDAREADWGVPNLKNRYLARLAPFADATDGHVQSWDRIFAEFPHVRPLRLAGF